MLKKDLSSNLGSMVDKLIMLAMLKAMPVTYRGLFYTEIIDYLLKCNSVVSFLSMAWTKDFRPLDLYTLICILP